MCRFAGLRVSTRRVDRFTAVVIRGVFFVSDIGVNDTKLLN